MDFLKKNYEKVSLAVISLLLILSAVWLMSKVAMSNDEAGGSDSKNIKPAVAIDSNEVLRVSALLNQPPQWKATGPAPFVPAKWKYLPETGELVPGTQEEKGPGPKIENVLDDLDFTVSFNTFPMLFMGVATGTGSNVTLQVNIANGGTRFIKLNQAFKEKISRSGTIGTFIAVKYEQKTATVFNPSTRSNQKVDVSVVVLNRSGGDPITLIRGQKAMETAPTVSYTSRAGEKPSSEMLEGTQFIYKGKKFKVLDITSRKVIIQDLESGNTPEIAPKSVLGQ